MNNSNTQMEQIQELVKKLNKWSYEYYTLDNPTVSDKEYDYNYDKLVKLEKETGIILPNSPTQRVGDMILEGFKKVTHKNKLWSQDKAQSKEELIEWHNKNVSFCKKYSLPKPQYIVSKKYDGLSIKTDYEKGAYVLGSSRGNGVIGEDLTEQIRTTINLPKEINNKGSFSFRGEGLMTKKAFEEYNKKATIPLKNLRNGVAGAFRNLDIKETSKRKPIICFYELNNYDESIYNFKTYEEQLIFMKEDCNLPITEYKLCNTIEEVIEEINNIEKTRGELPYDIDGAVICLNDLETQKQMGFTQKFPKYSIAYKYEAEELTTTIKEVVWQVGRTGRITPVAIVEPVELNGATITKATLNNIDEIRRKQLKINSVVFIRRSNDVIPEITGVAQITGLEEKIGVPKVCPNCGAETVLEQNASSGKHILRCPNANCTLLQAIDHYCSRNAMNIRGLSKNTIKKFIDKGFLTSFKDIYKLSQYEKEIKSMEGFGEKSYNKLIKNIEDSKNCKLENFIYALGIPNVGLQTAKNMVEFANNNSSSNPTNQKDIYFTFPILTEKEWLKMKDCGEVLAKSLNEYFSQEKLGEYFDLCKLLNFESNTNQNKLKDNIFSNKKIVITGTFSDYSRKQITEIVENNGGKVSGSVSKKTDYVIVGESAGSKLTKAKELGITIIDEERLIDIINHL